MKRGLPQLSYEVPAEAMTGPNIERYLDTKHIHITLLSHWDLFYLIALSLPLLATLSDDGTYPRLTRYSIHTVGNP
jgi:hypothetical protein